MKVCKFGGSSMANADAIMRVEQIVRSDDERRYIVVSAPGKRDENDVKVTDLLYLLKSRFDSGEDFKSVFDALKTRFTDIEIKLLIDTNLDDEFAKIEHNLKCGFNGDYIVSRGEYLSAKILATKLGIPFVDSAELVRFESGKLDFETTISNLQMALKHVKRAVLPGFYGSDENKEIKTFSRGGSDITGSFVAVATGADVYENWTDVDGIFTFDPRKDANAKHIAKLSYKDMYELALNGANVLHKDAVYPVETAGIPINIKNTFNPSCGGTIISN